MGKSVFLLAVLLVLCISGCEKYVQHNKEDLFGVTEERLDRKEIDLIYQDLAEDARFLTSKQEFEERVGRIDKVLRNKTGQIKFTNGIRKENSDGIPIGLRFETVETKIDEKHIKISITYKLLGGSTVLFDFCVNPENEEFNEALCMTNALRKI